MSKWQPIETAPKDGTHILACGVSTQEEIGVIAWNEGCGEWRYQADGFDAIESQGDRWCDMCVMSIPSHWQPLPTLPTN